jgi:hypothetical protein
MAESIEQLRIYKSARELEDQVYELVKQFPANQFYSLGNDLRRASAGVSHRLKLDALAAMRREAEATQKHLASTRELNTPSELVAHLTDEYTGVIKQSWGLTKWLKAKLTEKQEKAEIAAKEEMAAAAAIA